MIIDRKPPENNPPSKKGMEVMEQLVKEREEEMKKSKLYEDVQKEKQWKNIYKVSIVNDWTDMCADDVPPKQIQISDYHYAFIENGVSSSLSMEKLGDDNDYELWVKNNCEGWVVVSDLTELRVWEYQEIKSYAVAIGWINEDEDLFI